MLIFEQGEDHNYPLELHLEAICRYTLVDLDLNPYIPLELQNDD